jgi:hypothetical protein
MIVGITGHQDLGSRRTEAWVKNTIDELLESYHVSEGVSSLAVGADQMFASALMAHGIPFVAIVPSRGYEGTFETSSSRRNYAALLSHAAEVVTLDHPAPSEEAFLAAGEEVVRRSDMLFAIWNGKPAAGLGGTADVVNYARKKGIPVVHVDLTESTVRILD